MMIIVMEHNAKAEAYIAVQPTYWYQDQTSVCSQVLSPGIWLLIPCNCA